MHRTAGTGNPKRWGQPSWRTHPTWALPKRSCGTRWGQDQRSDRVGTGQRSAFLPHWSRAPGHVGLSGAVFLPYLGRSTNSLHKEKSGKEMGFPVTSTLVHLQPCICANRIIQHRVTSLFACLVLSVCQPVCTALLGHNPWYP